MEASTGLLSLEAYAALDEPEHEYVTELVRGVVVREPRPGRTHGRVQMRLGHLLSSWVDARGQGEVTAESGYILSADPGTVRGPDVAVVLEPPETDEEPGGWLRGAPDLAVEVLSPSDSAGAMQQKVLEYLDAGASLVWIVDPRARSVAVYRADRTGMVLAEGDTLEGAGVLPGFSVPVGALFES